MSVEAITWALAQPIERSSTKFVLVAMANCAGAEMLCWPSVQYLCDATSQDRKTVLENIKRLREAGYIDATEERRGATHQVVVYVLKKPENGTVEQAQKRNSTENGTVPKTEPNSPVFPVKQSRFSAETVPKTGHGTVRNRQGTVKNPKSAPETVAPSALVEVGFDAKTADDFIAHKRSVKAPLTPRAWAYHLTEARKAGWTPMQAAEHVMAKGWKGFEAKYVADEKPPAGGTPGVDEAKRWMESQHLTPEQIEANKARAKALREGRLTA